MRTAMLVLAAVLAPVVAAPTISVEEATESALELVRAVSAYSDRHPSAPGSVPTWSGRDLTPRTPILIHDCATLEPAYYYVPFGDSQRDERAFVTVSAYDGGWQAYGSVDGPLARVGRTMAARAVARLTGCRIQPTELAAVSAPDRRVYWLWRPPDGTDRVAVSLSDSLNVRFVAAGPGALEAWHSTGSIDLEQGGRAATTDDPPDVRRSSDGYASLNGRDYPPSYDIPDVPHHYQLNDVYCAPASIEMLLDYWGPDIDQQEIAQVACTGSNGTRLEHIPRAAHFSEISTAYLNHLLHGYSGRSMGYGGMDNYWSYPDDSDPDYVYRHHDLKRLVSSGYPLVVVTRYDPVSYGSHARVVKGYDDSTCVYIVHDPWYDGVYQGPDVHFNQYFFDVELWSRSRRWGCLIAPWEITVETPDEVPRGIPFTLTAHVVYTGPDPFYGQHRVENPTVTLMPSDLFTFAEGESPTRALSGWFSDSGCRFDPVTWELVAGIAPQAGEIRLLARGLLNGSTVSYPSYSDSIGAWATLPLDVVDREHITVDPDGHGDFVNIQDALDFARDGETVRVSPGVFSGARNRDLTFRGKDVALVGSGSASTVIDCWGRGRGFMLAEGEDRDTVIEGMTIIDGAAPGSEWTDGGGAIYLDGASPTIRDVLFESNSSTGLGAGLCCVNGAAPYVERCTFWRNEADVGGGALAALASAPELVNCTLAANAAPAGAGVFCSESSTMLMDSILWGSQGGYPIACEGLSSPMLTRCCVSGNAAGDVLPPSCETHEVLLSDPLFCDPSRGQFQLQECSPCARNGSSGDATGAHAVRCACAETDQLPQNLYLHAPRPTPFEDVTTVTLDVPPQSGRVRILIYDTCGRLVRTLVDRRVEAGRRAFTWNGKDAHGRPVAAGVYFLRCETETSDSSRKLVLIR